MNASQQSAGVRDEGGSIRQHMSLMVNHLERLLEEVEGQAGQQQEAGAARRVATVRVELVRYLQLEERVLEPLLRSVRPELGLDTASRHRHHVLVEHAFALERLLHVEFPFTLLEGVSDLRVLLQDEQRKCAGELHSRLDQLISAAERQSLLEVLRGDGRSLPMSNQACRSH